MPRWPGPAMLGAAALVAIGLLAIGGYLFLQLRDDDVSDEHSGLIRVSEPRENALVTSPLVIRGSARGTWFFEATFPIRLLAADGSELAAWYATAQDDWMTEDFVAFEATVAFDTPASGRGVLVLEKSNPSGLAQYSDEVRIPVRFR